MAYINLDTMEYPRFIGDIELNPNANWQEVENSEYPIVENGQFAYEETPQNINGVWKQVWAVRNLTENEVKKSEIERIKNKIFNNQSISLEEAQLLSEI